MLSGNIEVLTEQIGGGIPGLNSGALDNWLMGMAQSNTGRAALKHLVNALGEGAEEFISEIAGAYLAQMWNGDEPDFWQTLGDAFYAGLIGTLTSACMSVPGDLAELNNAHTVDTALNVMQNGEALSGTQLADADRAMQRLTGKDGSESPWSRIPAREWEDAKSWYLNNYFPQMADLTGHTGELSGIDTSNIIFLPTGDELKALAKANADSNAVSSPAANNAAVAQNGPRDLSNLIFPPMFDKQTAAQNSPQDLSNVTFFPTGDELKELAKANADVNAASSPALNNATTAQNGQRDLSNVFFFPTRDQLERWAKKDADANAALSPAANNTATAQNGQRDLSNVFFFPTRDQLEKWAKRDADATTASPQAANNPAAAQNGQTNASETVFQPGLAQNANDVSTEFTADKTAGDLPLQTGHAADMASPEMIAAQNAKTREQALEEGKAKEGGQAEMSPEMKNAPESTGKTSETSFSTEEMSVEGKKDVANAAAQEYNENKGGRRVEIIDGVKHYYDDNGNLYRVKNDLQPNCEYELNGYKYQTDDIRRIRFAEGILHLKERKGRLPIRDSIEDIGKGDQKKGDNRGHLIGDQFDASSGLENLVPQDVEVN